MAQQQTDQLTRSEPSDRTPDPLQWGEGRRRRYGWLVTISLLFLMMLNWADKAVLGIAAVPIMEELKITPEAFGLVSSAMFLTFALAQILGAPLVDKFPTKWALLALCLLWSVAQIPVLLFASLPALWTSRLILGAGEGPLAPTLVHGVYKWFPDKKGATPAGVATAGVTLGIVAFSPVLAWVVSAYGWRAAFAVLAIVGALWGVYWLAVGKEGPYAAESVARPDAPAGAPVTTDALRIPYLRTILTPTWIFAVLSAFFAYWTFTLAMSWGPAYFQTVLHLSGQQAGSLIALPSIWGTLAMIGLSALAQRLHLRGIPTRRARGWVLGGAAILSGGSLLAAVTVSSPVASVALMVIGFGTAPALFTLTLLVVSELTTVARRGANLSLANAVLTSGGIFAPAVSGVIIGAATTKAEGYTAAFALAGGLTLAMGILAVLFINQQRDRRRLGLGGPTVEDLPVHH
ncbi:MFS transporter [Sinomonas soli]